MKLRNASELDLDLLAELNQQLIEDERADNPMSLAELRERMRGWLASGYQAVVFELASEPVAYALFRPAHDGIYLRQFFVARIQRRRGIGRDAIALFRKRCVPAGSALTLEVLAHNEVGQAFWRATGFREHAPTFRIP